MNLLLATTKVFSKFKNLLKRASKVLNLRIYFVKLGKRQVNFKISWASNFGSKIWAKL